MIPEPEKVIVERYWNAALPKISNTLELILEQLKILNENNTKEE